jgi:hypothetical protein
VDAVTTVIQGKNKTRPREKVIEVIREYMIIVDKEELIKAIVSTIEPDDVIAILDKHKEESEV